MYKFVRGLMKVIATIFYRIKVDGDINLFHDERYMICSNHIHMFDPVALMVSTKRPISFMIKKELSEKPILGQILLKSNAIPVDRGANDITAIKTAIDELNQNKVLAIFPEGTRHKDGQFRDIKKGAALIAIKAQAPIIPVHIKSTYRLFSRIDIKVGEPIYTDGYKKDEITEKLQIAIEQLAMQHN